jgi:hypothetical protein
LASDDRWLERLRLELTWFTGQAALRSRGAGAILRFAHVRPRRHGAFQPQREHEITPQFLDRAIRALKRWKYDIIGMDEVCRRAVTLPEARRFVALTFDGAPKDLITFAYPVLARHAVPFTVYVPTAFPDGVGEAWWLGLTQMIARESRVSLMPRNRRCTRSSRAGCARCRRRICRLRSPISARATASIWPRSRARRR